MTEGTAKDSAIIHAPATRVYGIIADYRVHHPRIVPPEYFRKVEVEAGCVGAGTRIHVETRVLGKTQQFTHTRGTREPRRVLDEVNSEGFTLTRVTVEPAKQDSSRVTIQTTFRA